MDCSPIAINVKEKPRNDEPLRGLELLLERETEPGNLD
jgi:hypothetical protein